jgi:hypothetical protein
MCIYLIYIHLICMHNTGVFGFINSHRPTLVLSYTHDPLPPQPDDRDCKDLSGPVANDQHGRPMTCAGRVSKYMYILHVICIYSIVCIYSICNIYT